jgi:protein-tyrosine phosphatase
MIDLHCHVLPGVDDGPATEQEAIELARGARADGITKIVATPHIDGDYPNLRSGVIRGVVRALQSRLDAARVDVTLETGAEVSFTQALGLDDAELGALTLGGGGWLLLECPLGGTATPGFTAAARTLVVRGHRVLLAHPERCPIFLRSPEALEELVAEGMLAQVTARALSGGFGRTVRDLALHLVERGTAQVVASDGHGGHRPASIAQPLRGIPMDPALREWLTLEMPSAVLAGAALPERPDVRSTRPRGRLSRLVRR